MQHLKSRLRTGQANSELRRSLLSSDGRPLDTPTLRVLLVVMMIQLREPRATLWPLPHPEATGDIIEAAMGICFPRQNVHLEHRNTFASAWGFQLSDLTPLHGKFEDAIKHISTLATYAHHHKVAAEHGCPKT
eukprot:3319393-Pyramimonas_sp.AAC.1